MYPPFWTVWHEASTRKYPVFYLLHGAMDTDDAWTFVDRAGFILDNLLADGKIKPMIVVMPAGHQPGQTGMPGMGAAPPAPGAPPAVNPFTAEFMTDIMPYVEKTTGPSTTGSIAPLRASQWAARKPSTSASSIWISSQPLECSAPARYWAGDAAVQHRFRVRRPRQLPPHPPRKNGKPRINPISTTPRSRRD